MLLACVWYVGVVVGILGVCWNVVGVCVVREVVVVVRGVAWNTLVFGKVIPKMP